jgi:hypothetical protein
MTADQMMILANHETYCPEHGGYRDECGCPAYPRAAAVEAQWGKAHPLFAQMRQIDRQNVLDHAALTGQGNPLAGLVAAFDAERAAVEATQTAPSVPVPIDRAIHQGNTCPVCGKQHSRPSAISARHVAQALASGVTGYDYDAERWVGTTS